MKKRIILALAIVTVLVAATIIYAEGEKPGLTPSGQSAAAAGPSQGTTVDLTPRQVPKAREPIKLLQSVPTMEEMALHERVYAGRINMADVLTSFLNPSMGAFNLEQMIEGWIGHDIGWDPAKDWGDFWGYAEAGFETYWCRNRISQYFTQDYGGHYVNAGDFPTVQSVIIYAFGKRTEYVTEEGIDWRTSYTAAGASPNWFPKIMSSIPTYGSTTTRTTTGTRRTTTTTLVYSSSNPSLAAMGYLYKISWLVKHPYTAEDVLDMDLNERYDKGLDSDGNITFRVFITEAGIPCMYRNCYQLSPRAIIAPGGQSAMTLVQYKLPYLTKICLKFDTYKWDGEHTEYPAHCNSPDERMGMIVRQELAGYNPNFEVWGVTGTGGQTGDGSSDWDW